jgi:putative membrane protein
MDQYKEISTNKQNDSPESTESESRKQPASKYVSDHLANERTFLAWVRTGIAVLAFGFVIERFGLLLHELGLKFGSKVSSANYSKWLGIIVVCFGIILLIVALFNFLHVRRSIEESRYRPVMFFAIVMTSIAALIGILLSLYLLSTT